MKKVKNFIKHGKKLGLSFVLILLLFISCKDTRTLESDSIIFMEMINHLSKDHPDVLTESRFSDQKLIFLKIKGSGLFVPDITHYLVQFKHLYALEIQKIQMDSLPDLSKMKKLREVDLSFNGIDGKVNFEKFPNKIKRISLSFNNIDSFYNCSTLEVEKLVIIGNKTGKVDCLNLLLDSCAGCEGWENTLSGEDRKKYNEYNDMIKTK